MNFLWRKPKDNKNSLQNRINNLQSLHQSYLSNKDESPTLKNLVQSKQVKRMSKIFENQLFPIDSQDCKRATWFLNHSSVQRSEEEKPSVKEENGAQKKLYEEKFDKIIQHENNHVKNLEDIVKQFAMINATHGYVPDLIREQHCNLSGNVENIIELHKQKIWPVMVEKDAMRLINHIISLAENGFFYCYVNHVMLYNSTEKWLENYKFVIDEMQNATGLYLHSGHMSVYEIIQQYFNWISDLVNEMLSNARENSDDIATCMDAEQKLDELLNLISEAIKIAYIKEVSRNNIEAIQKLYTILEKRGIANRPMLILVPRHSVTYGNRNPLDLLQLGKFVRLWTEKSEVPTYCPCFYDINLFIFEKCVVYTIIVSERHFIYGGHFWIKDCIFEEAEDRPGTTVLLVSSKRKQKFVHPKLVSLLMQLKADHKFSQVDEIELSQDEHKKILKKIEIGYFRRLSLAAVFEKN